MHGIFIIQYDEERKKEKTTLQILWECVSLVCSQSGPGPNRPACEADLDGLKFWI